MILTNCAACAAPLAHNLGKKCSRCKTRYCNEACQRQHWERGGHEALCRRIKRGGGAEQYHADKKYNEAAAVAVDPTERVDMRRLTTWGRDATLGEQLADLSAEREVARWMARLAARGLPPDWTEEELRRQGHDLDATQESSSEEEEEEDESSSEEEENNPRTGVPSALLADIEHSMSHEALLQLPIG